MIALKMSEEELNAHWDRIEAAMGEYHDHPTYGRVSEYLLLAYRAGMITWDQALELCMSAMRVGFAAP